MNEQPEKTPEPPDPEFDRLLEIAMRSCGWLLPKSLEQVRQAEEDPEIMRTELPDSLKDPFQILDRELASASPVSTGLNSEAPPLTIAIPLPLAQLALEEALTQTQTLTLLSWQGQVFAHRSSTRNQQPDLAAWRRFYQDVKEFL
jgi:hypothetical protein